MCFELYSICRFDDTAGCFKADFVPRFIVLIVKQIVCRYLNDVTDHDQFFSPDYS